jgi:acetylornithine deacetylase/succinyl-diaminopimelate desuccinylase-like protein
MPVRLLAMTFAILLVTGTARAATDNAYQSLAHDIFKELIEIDTTDSVGNVTTASEAMAKRLLDAGFPAEDVQLLGPNERKKNLVVRFHGAGKRKPILLGHGCGRGAARELGHGPLQAGRKGRLLLWPRYLGYEEQRCDDGHHADSTEEGGLSPEPRHHCGPHCRRGKWHLQRRRLAREPSPRSDRRQPAINTDGYSVLADQGKALRYEMYGTEKVYADYLLTATNRGGHSSLPRPDNAIYDLTGALSKLAAYKFPVELNDVTRAYYERMSGSQTGERADDMRALLRTPPDSTAVERLSRNARDNATMRTTCVATRLRGGHANNALPQQAQATVNCRILPAHSPEEVRQVLAEVIADTAIKVQYLSVDGAAHDTATEIHGFPPPALSTEVMRPLEQVVRQMWPGIKVVPAMSLGASDAVYTMSSGLPTYNITGNLQDQDDIRAHGLDERIRVDAFYTGLDFMYRYLKAITAK